MTSCGVLPHLVAVPTTLGFIAFMRISLALVLLGVLSCGDGNGGDPVSIQLSAMVGTEAFSCGTTYTGLGTAAADLTPRDFRFYVHDVRLVTADGEEVAVDLDDDGMWQNGEVALLDFENGCGDMGNTDLNDTIRGTAPAGEYTGVRFRLGVPENSNHADPTAQGAPLNLTALWWNWNAGYKFIRLDATSSAFDGWRVHLGSTACEGDMMGNASCTNLNVPEIAVDGFDPTTSALVIDLAELVSGSDLGNTGETQPGCMSNPMDADCAAIFESLGLPFAGGAAGTQRVFRAP